MTTENHTRHSFSSIVDQTTVRYDSDGTWREEHVVVDDSDVIISAAPHGGEVEPGTAEQAMKLAEELSACSGWVACGYDRSGSAFDRWHTPSHRISPGNYAYLPQRKTHNYHTAVTWHGYAPGDGHPDVYIGGQASKQVRKRVRDAIEEQANVNVCVAEERPELYSRYAGRDTNNITNWLAENQRGIQLEQTRDARTEHDNDVVEGVARALRQPR